MVVVSQDGASRPAETIADEMGYLFPVRSAFYTRRHAGTIAVGRTGSGESSNLSFGRTTEKSYFGAPTVPDSVDGGNVRVIIVARRYTLFLCRSSVQSLSVDFCAKVFGKFTEY